MKALLIVICVSISLRTNAGKSSGKQSKSDSVLKAWKKDMLLSARACRAHAELTSRASSTTAEVQASKAKVQSQLDVLLLEPLTNYASDFAFMDTFMRTILPNDGGRNVGVLAANSEFVSACYGVLELRCTWGHLYEQLAKLPGCLKNSEESTELDGRCFPKRIAEAMDCFQWCGDNAELRRVFKQSKKVRGSSGQRLLIWDNPMMRTQVTFEGARNPAVWERTDSKSIAYIMSLLESNVRTFQEELQLLKSRDSFADGFMLDRYEHILKGGNWTRVDLFYNRQFTDMCSMTPRTCKLLRESLPVQEAIMPDADANQQVMLFYGSPHVHVLQHHGATNGRINVMIGLEGYDGSKLVVHTGINKTKTLYWSDTKAFAFSDGVVHEVFNGPTHRYVLAISTIHPDISEAAFFEGVEALAEKREAEKGAKEESRGDNVEKRKTRKKRRKADKEL